MKKKDYEWAPVIMAHRGLPRSAHAVGACAAAAAGFSCCSVAAAASTASGGGWQPLSSAAAVGGPGAEHTCSSRMASPWGGIGSATVAQDVSVRTDPLSKRFLRVVWEMGGVQDAAVVRCGAPDVWMCVWVTGWTAWVGCRCQPQMYWCCRFVFVCCVFWCPTTGT